MSLVERRVSLRARILASEHRNADARAAATGLSLNCRGRLQAHGAQHEPCKAPHDDQIGVTCLCLCHDDKLPKHPHGTSLL
jgi:hypothetical protein